MENRSPAEILIDTASHFTVMGASKRRWPRPGQLIERLPEETRAVLRQLKSDDLRSANRYLLGSIDPEEPSAWVRDETFQKYGESLQKQRWANGLTSRLKQAFDHRRRAVWAEDLVTSRGSAGK